MNIITIYKINAVEDYILCHRRHINMNSYLKVEWRLRIQKLHDNLAAWQKQAEVAVREWSHMTEVGLQDVYHRILYSMIKEVEAAGYKRAKLQEVIIERPVESYSKCKVSERKLRKHLEDEMANSVKLLESLEGEITKRRLLEDEIHKLKHDVTDMRSLPESGRSSPRSFRSLPALLSPRENEKGGHFRKSISTFDQLTNTDTEYTVSPRSTGLVHLSPRRQEHDKRKQLHIALSPEVKNNMFDPKPTTIAKDFKSLFDNEYTKLFADMRRYYSEQYVVELLLSWLKDCYLTCIAIIEEQRENIREDALKCFSRYTNASKSLLLPNSCTSTIKEFQCKIASEAVPFIMKVCVRRLISGEENAEYPLQYIKRCAELCWLMSAQNPPMILHMEVLEGELINRKLFTSLIPRGEVVEYLVWPAVLRYSGGHMLQRGVVKTAT